MAGSAFQFLSAQKKSDSFLFKKDSTFKIMQFTDIHWESGKPENATVISMMESVLDKEQPDLVVFTGDIVTSGDPKKGWRDVSAPVIERKIRWIATLGNHESEGNTARNEIYRILKSIPLNVNSATADNIFGFGNFYLPISSNKNKQAAILYFFDSNEYVPSHIPGSYDWIRLDQIKWYKELSQSIKEKNDGQPIPALAFFHIPLPEYKVVKDMEETVGHKSEGVSSPVLNSGLFAAMVEQKDVIGVFTGHDHNNDFIGTLYDIALAYGRCSGHSGYGDLRIGSRVIELHQDQFHFKTWIATPGKSSNNFVYPTDVKLDFEKDDLLPAQAIAKALQPGLNYKYFEGEIESVNEIQNLKVKKTGVANTISHRFGEQDDHFALQFTGYLDIPEDGFYEFYLCSDDGAILKIDDQVIIDNDGGHSAQLKRNDIGLEKGMHSIEILYFEDYEGNVLEVGISGLSFREGPLPSGLLYHD